VFEPWSGKNKYYTIGICYFSLQSMQHFKENEQRLVGSSGVTLMFAASYNLPANIAANWQIDYVVTCAMFLYAHGSMNLLFF
jgi:hypothetical protein